MPDVFVRRTTAGLLAVIATLAVLTVVFIALYASTPTPEPPETTTPRLVARPKPIKIVDGKGKETPASSSDAGASSASAVDPAQQQAWEREYRIPRDTLPLHYDLYLHPDLNAGRFSGQVAIMVAVTSPKHFLVAHVKDMNVTSTKLKDLATGQHVELKDSFEYKPNQFWVVLPKMELKEGNYSMELEFNGNLDDKIVGFYKSVYTKKNGEKRKIATSKFQPTDARGAFPCFDEPSFKSTFSTTLVRPSQGYTALSNMPQERETPDAPGPGLTEVVFQKSVPMVTYLACFIVCDFEFLETRTQDNKLFRVYATPEQVSRAKYALDIGVDILNYFENYFEIKYPLPKQDQIAIPDFVSGAMEHWGLITYRESNLLYDPEGSANYNKQRVASVISHELAHMWFGNLVTLAWWDDLWLNEGFASYIEYKGVAHHEKDWNMLEQFVAADLQPVLRLDAQLSSHPIIQRVDHPDQITEIFDAISYSKGASVLRMLDNFMGEEPFRIGIRNFLRKFKFANAVTADLWKSLSETSTEKLDIAGIMDTWTKQMGYPVLTVKRIDQATVEVRQQRFLSDPSAVSSDDSPFGYTWHVPVTFVTQESPRALVWLHRDMDSVTLPAPASGWWKVNVAQHGYYRVNYDGDTWRQLTGLLKDNHTALSPADRSNLLDDAFSLAEAGLLDYSVAFELAAYLNKELDYIPWKTFSSHLSRLDHLLMNTKAYPQFRKYVLRLVSSHASRVGWQDGGEHLQRLLRPLLLSLACKSGDTAHVNIARQQLHDWLHNGAAVAANLRSVVYKYGMQEAGYDEWQQLLERYATEVNAQEKSKMMGGLTAAKQPWVIHRFLEESRNSSVVRTQNYLSGLVRAAWNPVARPIVWNFIKSNWDWLVSRYTLNSRQLGSAVKSVVQTFTDEESLRDAEEFFRREPEAGAGARARQQALEVGRRNSRWLRDHRDHLGDWFRGNSFPQLG